MSEQSAVETVDEVTRRVKVTIPAATVAKEVSNALSELERSVKIKGFRPGKAPRAMVEKLHGESVRSDVTSRLMQDSLRSIITQNNLSVVGSPEISDFKAVPDSDLEFTAHFEVFPSPAISGYEQFKVSIPRRAVADTDVDEVLEQLRKSKGQPQKLAFRNTAQNGDLLDLSIAVTVEGQEPARPEPAVIQLGEGKLPAEVEKDLVGLEVGYGKEVTVTLPADHQSPELQGKAVTYKVTLNSLSELVLPNLDDEFAKGVGIGAETLLELRMKIRERLEQDQQSGKQNDIQAAVLDQLSAQHTFKIPQSLIDDEIRNLLVRGGFLNPDKIDVRRIPVDQFREQLGEVAEKRVRGAIIVDRIAAQESIKPEPADVEAEFQRISEEQQVPLEEVKKFFSSRDRLFPLMVELTRSKVLSFLSGRASVEEVDPASLAAAEESGAENKKSSKKKKS